jgi:dTDP-4-amino-4,6-dideoxygalactose transaminase
MITTYQNAFAECVGVRHAFAYWKGRVALYAILKALGIKAGDEVILPGFTCVVVPNAVRYVGATPVFADITCGAYNLDPASVERAITRRTRALIIQHTFGIPAELDDLLEIARKHKLQVIEDCAHSLGSVYKGKAVGTFGRAAFFSSQWSKPYTTGLGGMAVTADPEVARGLRKAQTEFSDPPRGQVMRLGAQRFIYEHIFSPRLYWLAVGTLRRLSKWNVFVGSSGEDELNCAVPRDITWRMSCFQASIGVNRLRMHQQYVTHRRHLVDFYQSYLQSRGWLATSERSDVNSIYLRYPIRVANKWEVLGKAEKARVELGSWFESTLHPIHDSLDRFGYHTGQCAVAERTASEIINLPLHSRVSIDEAERIVEFVCKNSQRPALCQ